MSVFRLGNAMFRTYASAVVENPGTVQVEWPGGDGWLILGVGASFSGGAFFQLVIDDISDLQPGPTTIPGLDHINTSSADIQVFPFSAPKGIIAGGINVPSPGDAASGLTASLVTI